MVFDFNALATDTTGKVTDSKITYNNVNATKSVTAVGYAAYERKIFTVETPVDSFQNTYFTANFAETEFVSGEYLAIDLKVEEATISGGASSNYAFQIKLNGKTMQQPAGVYKQTFGQEFGVYQRGGSGTGYFGNGVWFFMNVDLDAIVNNSNEVQMTEFYDIDNKKMVVELAPTEVKYFRIYGNKS